MLRSPGVGPSGGPDIRDWGPYVRLTIALSVIIAATALTDPVALASPAAPAPREVPAMSAAAHRNMIRLRGVFRTDQPPDSTDCQPQDQVNCYTPAQMQQAYDLLPLYAKGDTGKGRKIVIVDAYSSPTIRDDLTEFSAEAGLPEANLEVVQPVGKVPAYDPSNSDQVGWAGEITLDAEVAHTVAPDATIVLVEAPGDAYQLNDALQYAISHRLGDVISLSWGITEQLYNVVIPDLEGMFRAAARAHITIVDASGDDGATSEGNGTSLYTYPVTAWPATDPYVTAVGGTALNLDGNGNRLSPDTVWNDSYNQATNQLWNGDNGPNALASGGGKSTIFATPSYQSKRQTGGRRGIPDVSMSASCSDAIDMYSTFAGQPEGWSLTCGTSESAPMFAAIVAIAAQVADRPLGLINPALYTLQDRHAPGVVLVTKGNNTVSFRQNGKNYTVRGYYAGDGYSMAAGIGTIDAQYFVPELAHAVTNH
jgi:subtilase family serine protease